VQINAADVKQLPEVREMLTSGARLVDRSLETKERIMGLIHLE